MKKVIILYDSIYGNTRNVAMSLSRGLEAGGLYVDSSSIQYFDTAELKNYDIIGIGGPTHFHGASKQMKLFLKGIKHLKIEHKFGFAFETKADFRLAGSAAKWIIRRLKKMKLKIIHSTITGIILNKEGPLQHNTSDLMEQIGLNISEKVNNGNIVTNFNQEVINLKNQRNNLVLNRVKWILLGGGPIFFFVRAIYLASTGGDCFGTINPVFSWFLLLLEISLSSVAGIAGIVGFTLWIKAENRPILQEKVYLRNIVLCIGSMTYVVHFIRVAIWLGLCVL